MIKLLEKLKNKNINFKVTGDEVTFFQMDEDWDEEELASFRIFFSNKTYETIDLDTDTEELLHKVMESLVTILWS